MKELKDLIDKYLAAHPELPKILEIFQVSQEQYFGALKALGCEEKRIISAANTTSDLSFSCDDLSTNQ